MKKLSVKILVTVYGSLILLSAYFIFTVYTNHLKVAEEGALGSLLAIANTLSTQLNGDSLQTVFETYPFEEFDSIPFDNHAFNAQIEALKNGYELNGLKTPIYTLTYDSLKDCFFIGAASNGIEPYGFHYVSPPDKLKEIYTTGGVIPAFEDDHGTWLSALRPIKNSSGTVVAALQVDFPFDDFIMYAQDDLKRNIGVSLALFAIIGVFLYSLLKQILRTEEQAVTALQSARNALEETNNDLVGSIEYASTIQKNIYPEKESLDAFFCEYFVFDRPRDIVSGDFHWFYLIDKDRALVAVADCTGHGVPGALMSIMGHNYLNEAVLDGKLIEPSKILEYLDDKIRKTFHKKGIGEIGNDGMDIGLCLIDKGNQIITYSGAKRPLVILTPERQDIIKGTRRGIGEHYLADKLPFKEVVVPIQPERSYFMYSDGLQDQFGGEKESKLMQKGVIKWLDESLTKSMQLWPDHLQTRFETWKGDNDQIDDICLMGFHLKDQC